MDNAEVVDVVVVPLGQAVEGAVSQEDASQLQILKMKYSSVSVCSSANASRKAGEFCDTKLIVANIEYPAHKMVLAGFSACFKAMFLGDFFESSQATISLDNIDGSIMEVLLDYIYTSEIEITLSNAPSLLKAAHFLMAEPLFELCCYKLTQVINAENCLSLQSVGETYSCTSLRDKAMKFVLENFAAVVEEDEFLELDQGRLKNLIRNDSLSVDKEEHVFEAVLHWMHHRQERVEKVDEVLREVRLAHMDSHFLNDRVLEEDALLNSPSCMRLVEEVNKYCLLKSRHIDLQSSFSRRRNNSPDVEAFLVQVRLPDDDSDIKIALTEEGRILYTPANSQTWCHVSSYCGLLRDDENICDGDPPRWYLFHSSNVTKAVNPKNISTFNNNRFYTAWSELDGSWFAIGGSKLRSGGQVLSCVDRYNSGINVWKSVSPLPEAVYGATAVSSGGVIFVLGGYLNPLTPSTELQIYNPLLDSWTREVLPIPHLYEPSACALNMRIYVCSKLSKKSVYVYDLCSSSWGQAAEMQHDFFSGPVVVNGRIFAITEGGDGERVIERYAPEEDSWKSFATFPGLSPFNLQGPLLFKRDKKEENHESIKVVLL